MIVPKELWKPCELYSPAAIDISPPIPPPSNKLPLKPENKLPPGGHPWHSGGFQMEEYDENAKMITFDVVETMLNKVSLSVICNNLLLDQKTQKIRNQKFLINIWENTNKKKVRLAMNIFCV